MKLKARSLDAVGAPGLYLVAGSVDHAKFVLPWAQLAGSKPVKVEIGALSLRLRAARDDDPISTTVEASAAERREDSLDAMRAQWTAFAEQTAARRLDSLVDCYTGHDNSTLGDDFSEFDHQWRVLDLG